MSGDGCDGGGWKSGCGARVGRLEGEGDVVGGRGDGCAVSKKVVSNASPRPPKEEGDVDVGAGAMIGREMTGVGGTGAV